MKDGELVQWALKHGWQYFYSNSQLRDPDGFMTTCESFVDIGATIRNQIIRQMQCSVTPEI